MSERTRNIQHKLAERLIVQVCQPSFWLEMLLKFQTTFLILILETPIVVYICSIIFEIFSTSMWLICGEKSTTVSRNFCNICLRPSTALNSAFSTRNWPLGLVSKGYSKAGGAYFRPFKGHICSWFTRIWPPSRKATVTTVVRWFFQLLRFIKRRRILYHTGPYRCDDCEIVTGMISFWSVSCSRSFTHPRSWYLHMMRTLIHIFTWVSLREGKKLH